MTDAQQGQPVLAELFRHNLWANLTLIDLCLTLPGEILETNVPGTFGGIRETLTHMVGAEERYLLALAGGSAQRIRVWKRSLLISPRCASTPVNRANGSLPTPGRSRAIRSWT